MVFYLIFIFKIDFSNFYTHTHTQITTKTTSDCVQFYYFWKKLCIDYKESHLNNEQNATDNNNGNSVTTNQQEVRPHVCEMPDCSAVSFVYFFHFFHFFFLNGLVLIKTDKIKIRISRKSNAIPLTKKFKLKLMVKFYLTFFFSKA